MNHLPANSKGTALVTGASRGIGSVYADRLAKCGYDLILVACSEAPLRALSTCLRSQTGQSLTALPADLNDRSDLAKVENTLRSDRSISMLVNNAGIASVTPLLDADVEKMDAMIALNITIQNGEEWIRFGEARRALAQRFGHSTPAPRYGIGIARIGAFDRVVC